MAREQFRLLSGEELVRTYTPAGGKAKAFCAACGSSLFGGDWPGGDEVSIRFGTLDGDPEVGPQYHAFAVPTAAWDVLPDDGLPRYERTKPGE